ncbi:uncharacterized protein LOC118183836 [Stegodyphus dumicola]|uniref:uncharacterized protein LOC118183836 n=1 Tax=Stegodyphus dumicola TaxID=202533 RepID=UPI0015A837E2|nr:uncharacterized protein LOC118183836 [Stegodyphus dumicola]
MWLLVLAYSLIHFSVVSSNLDACSRSVNEFCPLQPNLNFTDNEESLRAACAAFVGNAVCRSFLAGHCVGREIFKPGELDGIMQLTNDICVNKSNELRTMTLEAMPCIKLEYYESNCTHGEEELLRRYYQHVASYAPLFPQITDCINFLSWAKCATESTLNMCGGRARFAVLRSNFLAGWIIIALLLSSQIF